MSSLSPSFVTYMLFNILDLLPDLLNLRLQVDPRIGSLQIIGLRKNRIGLAVHLLGDKIKLPADPVLF